MPPLHCAFAKWITTTKTLIVPNMQHTFFPLVRFTSAQTLVTLGWDKNTTYYNLDVIQFPNVERVVFIDGHPCYPSTYTRFPIWIANRMPPYAENTSIHIDGSVKQLYWNPSEKKVQWVPNEWVNEDWLKAQYDELFRVTQNELRKTPELK